MKYIYGIIVFTCTILLLVMFFTNVIYLQNQYMYLGSLKNHISVSAGLGLIMVISIILGSSLVLFLKSLVGKKPVDFDDFDL